MFEFSKQYAIAWALWPAFVLAGCGDEIEPRVPRETRSDPPVDAAGEPTVTYPMPNWPTGDPSLHGFDTTRLAEAEALASSLDSRCLLVIHDGELIYESYLGRSSVDELQQTWSIAKSFTSTLVGIAIDRGEIEDVEQLVADFVPEWRGTEKEAITIRNLLSMDSGLEFDMVTDNVGTLFSADQTKDAIDRDLEASPGSEWHYSNFSVQILHRVLESATGMDPEAYAEQFLWGPIGMRIDGDLDGRTHYARDEAGNPTMYKSVHATCRDLARLGYLYLHEGRWQELQVVSPQWVRTATSPSQALNRVYGYLWWTNGEQPAEGSTGQSFDGTMMSFAPEDLFSAQGLGQCFIDVVPSLDTVYVHVRPAAHQSVAKWLTDPAGTFEALVTDGERIEHKQLMKLLLQASAPQM